MNIIRKLIRKPHYSFCIVIVLIANILYVYDIFTGKFDDILLLSIPFMGISIMGISSMYGTFRVFFIILDDLQKGDGKE